MNLNLAAYDHNVNQNDAILDFLNIVIDLYKYEKKELWQRQRYWYLKRGRLNIVQRIWVRKEAEKFGLIIPFMEGDDEECLY